MYNTEIKRYLTQFDSMFARSQVFSEFIPALEFLYSRHPVNMIEIGSSEGFSMLGWAAVVSGKKISVDLPSGLFGGQSDSVIERRSNIWNEYVEGGVISVLGSSHDQRTLDTVTSVLDGELVDFLFIDGDHRYDAVKRDYEMYKHLVSPNGIIAFHDINNHNNNPNELYKVEVDKFWNELTGAKITFSGGESWAGIGFLLLGEY